MSVPIISILKREAKQFCLNTALHGYRFIVLPKRILLERAFWAVIVIISLITAITLMMIAWTTFQHNPTILLTDSTHYPIWNYPFPAVTICNLNKMSKSATLKLVEKLATNFEINSEFLADELKLLVQMLSHDNEAVPERNFTNLQNILDASGLSIEEAFKEVTPSCADILERCLWKGEEKRCDSIFEQVFTTEGFCCAFNYYALKNHKFGGSLSNKIPKTPRRVSACGYQTALEVIVRNLPNDYHITQIPAIGHKVILHNSYSYPDWSNQAILTERKLLNMITITPTITYSVPSIQTIDIRKRNCLFRNETILHNFREYTYDNCLVECRMNLTRKYCGCIPFFYQNINGTYPRTKICTLREISCLSEYKHFITSSVPGKDINSLENPEGNNECGCLPDCEYVQYYGESSAGTFTRDFASNHQTLYNGINIGNQSVVRVFFNDLVGTRNRRSVIFSWHTLLAYFGGILGLFIGFSFVSVSEFLYYFLFKFVVDLKENTRSEDQDRVKINTEIKERAVLKQLYPYNISQSDVKFKPRNRLE